MTEGTTCDREEVADGPPRLHTRPEWLPRDDGQAAALIEHVVFGAFVTAGSHGLAVSHLPFLLDRKRGPHGCLTSHVAIDNEHAGLIAAGATSVAIFRAEHGYISSSWYPAAPARDSAPTWNFAVVHCHGRPTALDRAGLVRHLAALVERLERGRENRWRLSELGPGGLERRLPRILAFDLPIERLDAKFKMGQDERPADTQAAIARLADGLDPGLAALMSRCNADQRNKGAVCGEHALSEPRAEDAHLFHEGLQGRRK